MKKTVAAAEVDAALVAYSDPKSVFPLTKSVVWVRGCGTVTDVSGVGYISGKLCEVNINRNGVASAPISLGDSARLMHQLIGAEARFDLDIFTSDDGLSDWLQAVATEL